MTTFPFPETLPGGATLDDEVDVGAHLGAGGMADVYEGHKRDLAVSVAVKVLKPLGDAERQARFEVRFVQEARLAARINHPNVVRVLAYRAAMRLRLPDGREDTFPRPYVVMERLVGEELSEALRRHGPMAPARVRALALGCLAGLARGHELGIVHKDLKPQNLFLVPASGRTPETLRVMDFGVARAVDDGGEGPVTQTGEAWCTPGYAAPEYLEDRTVTPALDVYQMGLVLAEMLTGAPVVQVTTPFSAYVEHAQGITLPPALDGSPFAPILRRATARDPAARYADAGALHDAVAALDEVALGHALAHPQPGQVAPGGQPRAFPTARSAPTAAGATANAGGGGGAAGLDAVRSRKRTWTRTWTWAAAAGVAAGLAVLALLVASPLGVDEAGDEAAAPPRAAVYVGPGSSPRPPEATGAAPSCPAGHRRVGAVCVPPEMVLAGAGESWQGCDRGDDACRPDEQPGHEVALGAFLLDRDEVSVARYERCVEAGACEAPAKREGRFYTFAADPDVGPEGGPEGRPPVERGTLPVNGITWHQARALCAFEGKRLPTEAEWERAARGVDARRFPWGPNPLGPGVGPVANVADEAGHRAWGWPAYVVGYDDGYAGPSPVGALSSPGATVRGLGGNVAEWVEDCYDPRAYEHRSSHGTGEGAGAGGTGESNPPCAARVIRGGYFGAFAPGELRSAARRRAAPSFARYGVGVRCAKGLEAASPR